MRIIDADALIKAIETYDKFACLPDCKLEPVRNLEHPEMSVLYIHFDDIIKAIDNAPTIAFPFEICGNTCQVVRPQGECKGEFQLTELRRWLTSQGYSELTVDDEINEFTRFVKKMRGKEE